MSFGHQEAGDALRAFAGAGEQVVEVGDPAVGDPRLRPGDAVPAVGCGGLARQGGGVRAGLRFGQAVGADRGCRRACPGSQRCCLLVGAEREQGMAGQAVHADRDGDGGPARRDLLEHLQVDLVGLAAAAPLLGVRQAQQPRLAERREHTLRVGLGLLVLDRRSGRGPCRRSSRVELDQLVGLIGGKKTVDGHTAHCTAMFEGHTRTLSGLPSRPTACRVRVRL